MAQGMDANQSPRILITRLSAIGDCILTMPVACAIREAFPNAYIAWMTQGAGATFLHNHPAVDEVIKVPKGWLKSPGEVLKLRKQLRQKNFDWTIDAQSLTKSAMGGWLSGCKSRVGFARGQGRELAPVLNNIRIKRTADHVVDAYLQLLKPLGITSPTAQFSFPRDADAEQFVADYLLSAGVREPFVVLNPGAGWPSKVWPAERYTDVAKFIGTQFNLPSVVVWAGGEEKEWAELISSKSDGHCELAPSTTLPQLAAMLRKGCLFVGSDTGPLHMAAAVGTPCIGMYGPTMPSDCGPYGEQHVSVQAFYQDGTGKERRRGPNTAMCAITVEMVTNACDEVLSNRLHLPKKSHAA